MEKDRRLYARFTLGFPNHPKILILSDAAFRCLVEATLWSREQEKDGFLARRLALAKWSLAALQELCVNDDENPSLIEREEGWYIHDYAEHQETKADVEARRERNRLAGQKGGLAKAKRSAKRSASNSVSNAVSEMLSENVAEKEKEKGVKRVLGAEPTPVDAIEPSPQCSKHANDTDPPPCHGCRKAREANSSWRAGELDRRRAARASAKAAADACATCHGTNWVPDTDPAVKCGHDFGEVVGR